MQMRRLTLVGNCSRRKHEIAKHFIDTKACGDYD